MKLISWNVNGLRACVKKGFLDFIENEPFDILCLQETKMDQTQAEFTLPYENVFWNSAIKKGYSGTLVISKKNPINVTYGIGISEHDNEGRVITSEFEKFFLVNVYTPNSKRELLRLEYRKIWEDDLRKYVLSLEKSKPVIICGDLNVAHQEIDLKNPKTNTKNPGFTKDERDKMTELLSSGYIDSFRHIYPDKTDAYTWWSQMSNARERNIGWRIDYFIVSEKLKNNIDNALIFDNIYGSDHCPVGIYLSNM